MTARTRRLRQELTLLCQAGLGIELIAPEVCRLLRALVGCEAAALFWLDAEGMPLGFFHENSPASARELFANEFGRLFVGPGEINVFLLAQRGSISLGNLARPDAGYYRSNTFNLLVRASGHHHTLDMRIDIDGRTRFVVLLFREQSSPFEQADAAILQSAAPHLREAARPERGELRWNRAAVSGHMLVDRTGRRLLLVSTEAELLLRDSNLMGQGLRISGPAEQPPRFVQDLCAQLALVPQAGCVLQVPAGRLVARCSLMRPSMPPSVPAPAEQVLVTLELEVPSQLSALRRVMGLTLSPLQQRIAAYAALGGSRKECSMALGVSKEALKKHLAVIYDAAGTASWEALQRSLG
ncbi:hypothetical protein [Roseococcus sp.]|uniref:helix-turn-helix transcriptional regulator n=1 Tax=Roseococcus sp. TaxID=2109646 RepID=UPI003BACE049